MDDIQRMKAEINKMVDNVQGRADGLVKVAYPNASMANNSYRTYRSSFLTMGDMQIPDDYREIFKWCRYFFKTDSLVGPAIRALATFPITDYIVNDSQEAEENDAIKEDETSDEYKFYKGMLEDLNLKQHLIEIGYDYHLYGNCIILAEPGLKTVRSRDENGDIQERKEMVWKSIRRLDPLQVRINLDPKTNEKIYYYEVPQEMRHIIKTKKPKDKYDRIPKIFKEAVKKNGVIRLNSQFVYSFSMPSESGDNGLWATPPIFHALKLIMYKNVLRQAQEALAYEHIIPKRIYFFENNGTYDPNLNFGEIADDFAFELKKQINDPNYQVISPIPVQQVQQGGQGRHLLLVPEIEQLDNTILAALKVPREFIFGGMSYSGSTTSLRILENDFITYRALLKDYVNNFLIKRLAEVRGEWEVQDDDDKLITVTFADLKMQDDIQQKELMVRLNQAGKLPDEVLYEKVFGLDSIKVKEQMKTEMKENLENQFEMQMMQAKMQQDMEQAMMANGIQPPQPEQSVPNEQGQMAEEQGVPKVPQEQPTEQPQGSGPPQPEQGAPNVNQQALVFAQHLVTLPDREAEALLTQVPAELQNIVFSYYQQLKDNKEMETDMRPAPEKLPPRREGGV